MAEDQNVTHPIDARLAELHQTRSEIQHEIETLLRERTDHSPIDEGAFALEGPHGAVQLSQLFGEHDDLVVVHNMGRSCPYCTLWADGLNGMRAHFESRAGFVVCSPDAPAVQQAFARERGWTFGMVSDRDGAFSTTMGFRSEQDGKAMVMPGFSTLRRAPDGSIRRVAHAPFGPGDVYCSIWQMFALLDGGSEGWHPKFRY